MNYNYRMRPYYRNYNDDRFFGGFLGPFLLGGITGAVISPAFNQRPYYNYYPYPNYYYYGGYYR